MNASSTLFWEISSRVILTIERLVISLANDCDLNLRALGALEHLSHLRVFMPSVALPSTFATTSPGRKPARKAGDPGIGANTIVTSLPILPGRD